MCAIRVSLLVLAFASFAFAQSAKIQGVISDDTGKTPAGLYVVATAQSFTDHRTYTTRTGAAGDYAFPNLPPGKYSLCVQAPGGPHLGSCQWATPTQVDATAAQPTTQNISVTQGGVFQLRIDDPSHLSTPTDDLFLSVGLPTGLMHPMRLAAADPTGRTYDVAVPLKSTVKLTIVSARLQISDDKGKDLTPSGNPNSTAPKPAASATLIIPGPQITKGPPVIFTITGRK